MINPDELIKKTEKVTGIPIQKPNIPIDLKKKPKEKKLKDQKKKGTDIEKKRFRIRDEISVGAFIAYFFWILYTMFTNNIHNNLAGRWIFIAIIIFVVPVVFVYGKINLMGIIKNILDFIQNPSLQEGPRQELIKEEASHLAGTDIQLLLEKHIQLREKVPSTIFVFLIFGISYSLFACDLILFEKGNAGLNLFIGMILFGVCPLLGFEKVGMKAAAVAIYNIVYDNNMSVPSKLGFIRHQIEQWIGIGIALEMQKQAEQEIDKKDPKKN